MQYKFELKLLENLLYDHYQKFNYNFEIIMNTF